MTAGGDDQPTRKRRGLGPIPVVTGVLAVIGAVALTVFLSGCGGPSAGPGSAAPTYRVTATVPVGKMPGGVAVDPGTHTVYVTNFADRSVSVIDGSSHAVTATVTVGDSPNAVAVDPSTHIAYVTNYLNHTLSVIKLR
jgi:YVTN family beta-propeller protein